jgi:peroxiredoxin
MSGLPEQRVAVAVGSKAPDFRSLDSDGREFRLSMLAGSRVLLKFFRGTWCPYCVADLRLWDEQREELRALRLKLVAVSHDSAGELRQFKSKHGWDVTLVADDDLEIIRRYNLQNHNFTPTAPPKKRSSCCAWKSFFWRSPWVRSFSSGRGCGAPSGYRTLDTARPSPHVAVGGCGCRG